MGRNTVWDKVKEENWGCRAGQKINLIWEKIEKVRKIKVKTIKKSKKKISSKEVKINRKESS